MSVILGIETATPVCSVAIGDENDVFSSRTSHKPNAHSELLTVFIEEVIEESGVNLDKIDAIAVSKGPGSYTGLRIGVSAAKGLCYAKNKPLIALSTLQSMAFLASKKYSRILGEHSQSLLFCPMIDARRMEVYSAVYDSENREKRTIISEIITEVSYQEWLKDNQMVFFGNGSHKCNPVIGSSPNAIFDSEILPEAKGLVLAGQALFTNKDFEDTAYFEPYYLKEFIAKMPKVKGLK